ncbi:MAG: malto-oligosyltrehalose synthase [Chitinivibrionales bacterium]|nr:malto-oligosyltrehalose synthase [Chitinivibrionales bacterium]
MNTNTIIPDSTYRLQFRPSFTFAHAREQIIYLKKMGISHIYASPVTRAATGSLHGYDVCDPREINPELGTWDELVSLLAWVKDHDMGWIQDIVPNHMAYSPENNMLMDVLTHGRASRYAEFFDINWDHMHESLRGRIIAPFLGKPLGDCISDKEISLVYENNRLQTAYYEKRFPVRPESYFEVFGRNLFALRQCLSGQEYVRFAGVLHTLHNLPDSSEPQERYSQTEMALQVLNEVYTTHESIRKFIDETIAEYNADGSSSPGPGLLQQLLDHQHYRLSFWRVAAEEINYRRFFTINDLIAVRVDNERVFNTTHALMFDLISQGLIQGLRIDHIDGLYDPYAYLQNIRTRSPGIYLVVEKILERNETLPKHWPVEGDTGYQFLNKLNGIFCRRSSERILSGIYTRFIGHKIRVNELEVDRKRLIIHKHMLGDLDNLAALILHAANHELPGNDVTFHGLRRALTELLVHFPVYRTYIDFYKYENSDKKVVLSAIKKALSARPEFKYEYRFIEYFFTRLKTNPAPETQDRRASLMRFQQFTGPLMAKGYEDTFLYIYNRLTALNEVGGWPAEFGTPLTKFHHYIQKRQQHRPAALNATATHDSKRGEDTRTRLLVLSEIPFKWGKKASHWKKINSRFKKRVHSRQAPDFNDEYLLYQTLIATLTLTERGLNDAYRSRIKEFMLKAIREAKIHTAWIEPDTDYEKAVMNFIDALLAEDNREFLDDLRDFVSTIAWHGMLNSLSQCLIRNTVPGVPDMFQGTELIEYMLVDPDNRREVDYRLRKSLLNRLVEGIESGLDSLLAQLIATPNEALMKMYAIYGSLQARRQNPELFNQGSYVPVRTTGDYAENIVAFVRESGATASLTLAPRFTCSLMEKMEYPLGKEMWKNTNLTLPFAEQRSFREIYSGEEMELGPEIEVGELITHFPVGLWISKG